MLQGSYIVAFWKSKLIPTLLYSIDTPLHCVRARVKAMKIRVSSRVLGMRISDLFRLRRSIQDISSTLTAFQTELFHWRIDTCLMSELSDWSWLLYPLATIPALCPNDGNIEFVNTKFIAKIPIHYIKNQQFNKLVITFFEEYIIMSLVLLFKCCTEP